MTILMMILNWLHKRVTLQTLFCILSAALGIMVYTHFRPANIVIKTVKDTQIVTVDKPVLTERVVTQVLTDPKDKALIKSLLAENAELKVKVTAFTKTLAELTSKGGTELGGVVTIPAPTQPNPTYVYHDWQLEAHYDQFMFAYTLNQKFEVVSTAGKAKDGSKVSLVNVFQLGANQERIPLKASTIYIVTDDSIPRWRTGFNVQAGMGYTTKKEWGGIGAIQWLRKGTGPSAEESRLALFSPGILAGAKFHEFILLPISVNLGKIPHQPLKDVWFSPFAGKTKLGLSLTATF